MKHLLNILATWRLMELIRDEDAPYDALKRFREYVRVNRATYYADAPNVTRLERFYEEVGQVLECDWCLSIWCGLFVVVTTKENIVYTLAYSAGALFLTQFRAINWERFFKNIK